MGGAVAVGGVGAAERGVLAVGDGARGVAEVEDVEVRPGRGLVGASVGAGLVEPFRDCVPALPAEPAHPAVAATTKAAAARNLAAAVGRPRQAFTTRP